MTIKVQMPLGSMTMHVAENEQRAEQSSAFFVWQVLVQLHGGVRQASGSVASERSLASAGIDDVIITSRSSHYGLRVSPTAGSILQQLIFGFSALAAMAVTALKYGNMLPKVAID